MSKDLVSLLGEGEAGKVKRKGGTAGKLKVKRSLKSKAAAVAQGSPEVLVKISSFGKGGAHAKGHLEYITREKGMELEDQHGQVYSSRKEIRDFSREWSDSIDRERKFSNQRDTMHVVLSMAGKDEPEKLKDAVRAFASEQFKGHEWVFALHTNTENDHCHLAVKCKGDKERIQVTKDDPQRWRELFAQKLREQGLEAEATPRQARGVVLKGEKQVIRHIDNEKILGKEKRVSKVREANQIEDSQRLKADLQGQVDKERPWEKAARRKSNEIRFAWAMLAKNVANNGLDEKRVNQNEPRYEQRPEQILAARRIAGQVTGRPSAQSLYKSSLGDSGRSRTTRTISSVRDLSIRNVASEQRVPAGVVQPNAHLHMGSGDGSNHEMRRTGIGATGNERSSGERERGQGLTPKSKILTNTQLAQRINEFIKNMPSAQTANEVRLHALQDEHRRRVQQSEKARAVQAEAEKARAVQAEAEKARAVQVEADRAHEAKARQDQHAAKKQDQPKSKDRER